MTPPLAGLTVLDFARFLPGAYPGWIAGDMGADVIRIEHPREIAKHAAMFGHDHDPWAAALRRARPTYARNKRSLLLNPGHPAARPVIEALVARADVLVEDYRPGVMAGMGLDYATLAAINPRLVYVSVSFAGQNGPLAAKAGHDPAALAFAGVLGRLSGTGEPTLPGAPVADVMAGTHATIAMLLALQARTTSGRGTHVDVAMTEASMPLLMVALGRAAPPDVPPVDGRWNPKGGVWRCADGEWLCTTDMEPAYWRRFCAAVGRPDYAAAQFDDARHAAIADDLRALFATRPRNDWLALLDAADTQVAPVLTPAEALAHPHVDARRMAVTLPVGEEQVTQIGTPFHLDRLPARGHRPAPLPGADGEAILRELGFDPVTIDPAAFSAERAA